MSSNDLAPFLGAAARWLGAAEVRVVGAGINGVTDPDPIAEAAGRWLDSGADANDAAFVAGVDRIEFAAVPVARSAALAVRRSVRKPRPAGQEDRLAAVAALVGRLLDEADPGSGDTQLGPRRELADAVRRQGSAVVLVIGVDRLAVVNEVFGRAAGDVVLDEMRRRIVEWAGDGAVTVRLGGTRFGVACGKRADAALAVAGARELGEQLAQPIPIGELPISRSVSIGVVAGDGAYADELVANAYQANLAARSSGGDTVREYDADVADEWLARLRLELELDNALRDGQLRLYYQPEFDLRTGQVLAVEALLRWHHPRLGTVRADAFVDDTERSRTFGDVQMWVMEEACRQLAAWQALPGVAGLSVRINVSAWQLARTEISDDLLAIIDRHGLEPASVCVELTERRIPRASPQIAVALSRLTDRGVSVAIDDFGTGEGTLFQLITLPVDTIKIDQSFVAAMCSDPRADAVVAGIIALATSLGLDTVAEGVDGADTAARLASLGCVRGQGNSLGEAIPADQVDDMLRR